MLNHIWLALIVIGILAAAGSDVYDAATDAYANGREWVLDGDGRSGIPTDGTHAVRMTLRADELRRAFPGEVWPDSGVTLEAVLRLAGDGSGSASLAVSVTAHARIREWAQAQGDASQLRGSVRRSAQGWRLQVDPVRFVRLRAITVAAFEAAGTAVQIAIGLIGIMALWLGVMKVAEEAGLVARLARAVRPVTVRLFPDVPAEHPAVTAMMMNIAANMLGLGNAATPFGLKAMEELNRLNPRAGTASNAMVTFLALNTSCITLIPATAIAVRAAAGSADPARIIGTTLLASLTATIAAVSMAKLLQRTRRYRLADEATENRSEP